MPALLDPPKKDSSRKAAPARRENDAPRMVGPTTQSVLASDDQFVVINDVPIFPEHSTTAKDGRKLVFDRNTLQLLCDSCNRRIVQTGDYATIIIGHTVDPKLLREGKAQNPPVIGYAGPFKLGLLGPPGYQRWCIFARFRIFKNKWEEARQFPRRSPELWLMPTYEQMFLDPIALLSETPRLDMGLLYSAELHAGGIDGVLVEKYAAAAPAVGSVFVPSDKYQGESQMAGTQEIVQAVGEYLDSQDWVQWVKQQMQAAAAPAAMGTAPAPDVNAPPPPAPEAVPADPNAGPAPADAGQPPPPAEAPPAAAAPPPAAAAAPPAAPPPEEKRSEADVQKNAAACPPAAPMARVKYSADDDKPADKTDDKPADDTDPVVQEKPGDDDDDDDDLEPEKDETVEQYRARRNSRRKKGAKVNYSAEFASQLTSVVSAAIAPLATRLDTFDKQLSSDRATLKNVERYAELEGMARKGYAIDPNEMLEKLKYSADGGGVSDDEFRRTIEILTKTGNRAPIDAPLCPVPDSIEQYSAQPGDTRAATTEHRTTAVSLCEKALASNQKPDYVRTLHNVVSGKNEAWIGN